MGPRASACCVSRMAARPRWERGNTSCLFFNATAPTEIYTLSLHDALPILFPRSPREDSLEGERGRGIEGSGEDRKSTRLNSSHGYISYAVFRLKKKSPARTSSS